MTLTEFVHWVAPFERLFAKERKRRARAEALVAQLRLELAVERASLRGATALLALARQQAERSRDVAVACMGDWGEG